MKEYIAREAALGIAAEWCPDDDGSVGKTGDLRDMLDELEAIPTADVEKVRHGKWVYIGGYGYQYRCSKCFRCAPYRTNYCPNCGAKMDGGADDDQR